MLMFMNFLSKRRPHFCILMEGHIGYSTGIVQGQGIIKKQTVENVH